MGLVTANGSQEANCHVLEYLRNFLEGCKNIFLTGEGTMVLITREAVENLHKKYGCNVLLVFPNTRSKDFDETWVSLTEDAWTSKPSLAYEDETMVINTDKFPYCCFSPLSFYKKLRKFNDYVFVEVTNKSAKAISFANKFKGLL